MIEFSFHFVGPARKIKSTIKQQLVKEMRVGVKILGQIFFQHKGHQIHKGVILTNLRALFPHLPWRAVLGS
jgi:hypothetical protein